MRRFLFLFALVLPAQSIAQQAPVRIVFAGDIMLDNGPGHVVTNGGDPFSATASVLSDADFAIGNLECAITRRGHAEDKPYTFKGPRTALPLLKRYFAGLSLANNHSGDWGKAGFLDELKLLREAGIAYFGGGANRKEAAQPLMLQRDGRRIALLGYNEFPPRRFEAKANLPGTAWLVEKEVVRGIRAARLEQKADFVLLYLHWGEELSEKPLEQQRQMARRFIEAGADAVIGAHPHVTQTIEWHRGRPIIYSLGNFVFDYFPTDPPVWTGWLARLSLGEKIGLEVFTVEMDMAGVPRLKPGAPRRFDAP